MNEIEAFCNLTVYELSPKKIKSLRKASHVRQAVFANVLNTNESTVQKWKIGEKTKRSISKTIETDRAKGI